MSPAWMNDAACKGMDPELMHPQRGDTLGDRAAKAVCAGCTVRTECLTYALDNVETVGIWGGASERTRRKMRGGRGIGCAECGTLTPRTGHVSYCSDPCRDTARQRAKSNHRRLKLDRVQYECHRCRNLIAGTAVEGRYCGWECASISRRERTAQLLEDDVA